MDRPRPGRESAEKDPRPAPAPSRIHRIAQWLVWCRPAFLSGLLLWLSQPPIGWSMLAWVALVPLATLVRVPWGSRPIYRPALAGGALFGLLAVHWIRYADDQGLTGYYGWWALAAYLALYFPAFVLIGRVAILRCHVPGILAVPVIWVGLEYLRSWALTGFPWYYLAHSQWQFIWLIQVADAAGAYGVSFVVALVNGWLVDVLSVPLVRPVGGRTRLAREQVWRLYMAAALLAGCLGYGWMRVREVAEPTAGPIVALMQTNIPQTVKSDEREYEQIRRQYLGLVEQLDAAREQLPKSQHPQLVIWPETSYLYGLHHRDVDRWPLLEVDRDISDSALRALFPNDEIDPDTLRRNAAAIRSDIVDQVRRIGSATIMGLNLEVLAPGRRALYNSAVLVTPAGEISEPYHKIHLVPWGEYLPLKDWMPWLRILTPHASADYGLEAGERPLRMHWNELSLGVLICFEDTVPWAARAYVRTDPVDVLINLTNDGWFGTMAEDAAEVSMFRRAEHEAHLAASVFRSVECRRPMVRAVNTGISAIIDSSGRLVRRAGDRPERAAMQADVVIGGVPLDVRRSLYAVAGDWLGVLCFALSLAMLLGAVLDAFLKRRGSGPAERRAR